MSFSNGEIVAGTYRVDKLIARGGMGEVYGVEHLSMHRALALKTIHPNRITQTAWSSFMKEGKVMARLEHPNLVKVYDLGIIENRTPYFVMDLIDGESLASLLKREGPLSVKQCMPIFEQIASGLAYAQALSLVHRDIKPGNIMLIKSPQGYQVKIVDLGLATEVNDTSGSTSGKIFGSPLYMSPEQCLGQPLDNRSDMYSLGCTLFEALTGTAPFIGENTIITLSKHQMEAPPSLKEASLGGDFPEELEMLLARLLAKDPAARFQNFEELARIFRKLKNLDPSKSKHTEPAASKAESAKKQNYSAKAERSEAPKNSEASKRSEASKSASKMRPLPLVAAGAAVAVILGLSIFFYLQSGRTAPGKTRPTTEAVKAKEEVDQPSPDESMAATAARINELYKDKSFSQVTIENGKKMRIFNFPENVSLGRVRRVDDRGDGAEARGRLSFPQGTPLAFQANLLTQQEPSLFRHFNKDDFSFLSLADALTFPDDNLLYIDHLTNLEGISLSSTTFGDGALKYLEKFPKLKYLDIRGTAFTPLALKHSSLLKRLETLQISSEIVDRLSDYEAVLKDSPSLKHLSVISVTFPQGAFSALCEIKNLESLSLSQVKFEQVQSSELNELSKLTNLKALTIVEENVPREIIPVLKKMPRLKHLKLGLSGWSSAERNMLEAAMKAQNTDLVIEDGPLHKKISDML